MCTPTCRSERLAPPPLESWGAPGVVLGMGRGGASRALRTDRQSFGIVHPLDLTSSKIAAASEPATISVVRERSGRTRNRRGRHSLGIEPPVAPVGSTSLTPDDPRGATSTLPSDSERADAKFLTSCYFADPTNVRPFMERCGVETVEVLGCEGVVSEVEEELNQLADPEFEMWVDLNYRLGKNPKLLAASAHILHVGRNR